MLPPSEWVWNTRYVKGAFPLPWDRNGGTNVVDKEKVEQIIEVMREALQADGGDIELIGVDKDGVVSVELTGSCAGCALSSYDLSMGIERVLKERVPGVTRVQAI